MNVCNMLLSFVATELRLNATTMAIKQDLNVECSVMNNNNCHSNKKNNSNNNNSDIIVIIKKESFNLFFIKGQNLIVTI